MHKAARMTQTPPNCLHCGRGNVPDDPDTLEDFWVIDLERDVNWGDPTYLCKYCVEQVGALAGMLPNSEAVKKDNVIQHQLRRIHDLEAKLEVRDRRLSKINEGRTAVKQVKKQAARTAPKKGTKS